MSEDEHAVQYGASAADAGRRCPPYAQAVTAVQDGQGSVRRRRGLSALAAALAAGLIALGACGSAEPDPAPPAPAATAPAKSFDEERAFRLIERQVAYGQRPAGSPQLRKLARRLRQLLPRGRFERIPGEPGLRNVIGTLPGEEPAIVIGAHYDTLVEPRGFVGANNGAAGTAIVVQLARELAREEPPPGAPELRFVLFDGEEPPSGLPEEQSDFYSVGLRGSRAYVAAHPGETREMILLDYVANKGLRLPREGSSTPELWEGIRDAARAAGFARFFPAETDVVITDDHTPFLRAGVPAVDMIDWSYPGHSLEDGVDKLSARSVDAVGETLMVYLDRASAGVP
jgi:glutaminyl-peptide cyclotransferase